MPCAVASLMMGETVNVARGIDTYSLAQPVGVCAGISPLNFPAMVPLWMFPLAAACGNAIDLKPSEQDPTVPNRLMELPVEAGAPDRLVLLVHGGKEQVEARLDHPDVRTVSFLGSAPVARAVYARTAANGERVLPLAAARNQSFILPDAEAGHRAPPAAPPASAASRSAPPCSSTAPWTGSGISGAR